LINESSVQDIPDGAQVSINPVEIEESNVLFSKSAAGLLYVGRSALFESGFSFHACYLRA
jgi:hypothetical protein